MADKEITVALAGRRGAGKTTLLQNLIRKNQEVEVVSGFEVSIKKDGKTYHFIDIGSQEESLPYKKFDVLLLCMAASPGQKFQDGNPKVMRSLQNAYGKDIWKCCVIVFTFSNLTVDRINSKSRDPETTYGHYFEEYTNLFQDELKTNLKVNANAKAIYSWESNQPIYQQTILGIPAGDMPEDQVLFGVSLHGEGWIDRIFQEIDRKGRCTTDLVPSKAIMINIQTGLCAALLVLGLALSPFAGEATGIIVGGIIAVSTALWFAKKFITE